MLLWRQDYISPGKDTVTIWVPLQLEESRDLNSCKSEVISSGGRTQHVEFGKYCSWRVVREGTDHLPKEIMLDLT